MQVRGVGGGERGEGGGGVQCEVSKMSLTVSRFSVGCTTQSLSHKQDA